MPNIKTVLVPVDFSERSAAAAEHAVAMANRFESLALFLHVVPPVPYEYAAFEGGYQAGALWPSELEKDEPPTRPAAVNLIQGKMNDVLSFFNNLTYDTNSTKGTHETLTDWRGKWRKSYFMEQERRSAKGKRHD